MALIKLICVEDSYPIRLEVLRKGYPLETIKFAEDFLPGSFHLGYFTEKNQLVGVVSCCEKPFYKDSKKEALQLKGVAVLKEYRDQGVARKLMKQVEIMAHVLYKELIWCNARVSASGFYQKLGYVKAGEMFMIPVSGPHFLMYKTLA